MRRPRDLCKRVLARGAVVFMLATLTAGGCGPIEYLNQVASKAASAVAAAKQAEADRYAPYEYTAAEEYLHKAREEAGYAQYQDSIEYGHKAEEMAQRARAIALERMSHPAGRSPSGRPSFEPSSQTTKGSDKGGEGIEPPPPPPPPAKRSKARTKPATPQGMEEDPRDPAAPASKPSARPNE